MLNEAQIQLQDRSGNWRTFSVTVDNDMRVNSELAALSKRYPGQRVRAVNAQGAVISFL